MPLKIYYRIIQPSERLEDYVNLTAARISPDFSPIFVYFPMQELVELSNLLIYNLLLKLIFRFSPPFVHEN